MTVWGWYPNMQLVVDNFNKQHNDVQVCWTNVGQGSDEYDKFQTAISAENGRARRRHARGRPARRPSRSRTRWSTSRRTAPTTVKDNFSEGAWKDVSSGRRGLRRPGRRRPDGA